jgi:hypothetical protein
MSKEAIPHDGRENLPEAGRFEYVEGLELQPRKKVEIDTTQTLIDESKIYKEMGVHGRAVAGVQAGSMVFLVLDTRNTGQYETPFLITTSTYTHDSSTGYKGVYPATPVTLGRHHYEERFDYNSDVSRHHFVVTCSKDSDRLFIEDSGSAFGTRLTGFVSAEEAAQQQGIRQDFTRYVVADIENERNYGEKSAESPHGVYRNHPIIGRRSPTMRNGVYGTQNSEFVLVDDKSRLLKFVVEDFMQTLPSGEDAVTLSPQMILKQIVRRVGNVMRYDLKETERLSSPHYDKKGMIDLSEYVERGVGVCRHQALLAALLIETVIERGYLTGRASVERNHDLEANGAHAWAVYKSDTAEDVIVDVAQNFVGSRKRAQQEGRWRYIVANEDD